MCSSYFVFGERPFIGMNFDFDREYTVGLPFDGCFGIMLKYEDHLGRPLGIRRDGTAAIVQFAPKAKAAETNKERAGLYEVLHSILGGRLTLDGLPEFLDRYEVGPEHEGRTHVLAAHRDGRIYVIEPGRGVLEKKDFAGDFAVMTNFSLWEHRPVDPKNADKMRCARYAAACSMLKEKRLGTERGFEILNAVKRENVKLPTIFSLVTELGTDSVYFALYGDFSRIYKYSFSRNTISTHMGFCSCRECTADRNGIETKLLAAWD